MDLPLDFCKAEAKALLEAAMVSESAIPVGLISPDRSDSGFCGKAAALGLRDESEPITT
jgi:hypothetical protein